MQARHARLAHSRTHNARVPSTHKQKHKNKWRCEAGKCWLVGSGPGSIDYLTVKAAKLLEKADVVLYDDLGSEEAMSLCREDARKVYVGKRGGQASAKQASIDAILVDACQEADTVVRLKGGCPSVFSRVHSEIAALQQAGIAYELVPGISSALSAPLLAGIPLTHVDLGRSFAVTSGHDVEGTDWGAFTSVDTLVLLMAGRNLGAISGRLQHAGWAPTTPVAVVKSGGTAQQQVWQADLASIVEATAGVKLSPCITVVGRVAAGTAIRPASSTGS